MLNEARQAVLAGSHWYDRQELAARLRTRTACGTDPMLAWLRESRIFAIMDEGRLLIPSYGLDTTSFTPVPAMREILRVLEPGYTAWGMAFWFESVNGYLGATRPREHLSSAPDGVLHPKQGAATSYFEDLPALEEVLRDHPLADVVITSSWRHSKSLDELRALFSPDLRHRIVGVTPDIPQAPGESDYGTRQVEVLTWLQRNGATDAPWIALEDAVHLYKAGAPVIAVADHFGPVEVAALRAALSDPKAFGASADPFF